ncbi:MAG: hypothetical protein HC771_12235 [Synechococcales cyanobacterium CRU_2_2]|nr:hypothetical protein [Synechococcales cyanobacterium CRU_2_2]
MLHVVATASSWQEKITLPRPQGNVYFELSHKIEKVLKNRKTVSFEIAHSNFHNILMGVAARERLMPDRQTRFIEQELSAWMPHADVFWRELQLFEAVARLASKASVDLPEILRDERQAWGRAFLRHVAAQHQPNSKSKAIAAIRKDAAALAERKSIVSPDLEPEVSLMLQYAFMLLHWDERESRLPSWERKSRGEMRKDLKRQLNAYISSLKSLATYLDRNRNFAYLRLDQSGQICALGEKNKLEPIAFAAKKEQNFRKRGGD